MGAGGAARPPAAVDGVRPRCPRLPRRSRGPRRRASEPGRPFRDHAAAAAAALGGDVDPDPGDRHVHRRDPRGLRGGRRAARRRTGDVSAATVRAARAALVGGEIRFPGAGRPARPARSGPTCSCRSRAGSRRHRCRAGSTPGSSSRSCPSARARPSTAMRWSSRPGSGRARRSTRWPRDGSSCGRRPPPRSSSSEHVSGFEEVRERLSTGTLGSVHVESVALDTTRIEMPAAGGVAGQTVNAYLVGRRAFVIVDPGDPTGPALDRAVALASELGGAIGAIALTHVDADHSAGAEVLAERLGIPILVGPGGGRSLPYGRARAGRWRADRSRRRPADRGRHARSATRPPGVRGGRGECGPHGRPRRAARLADAARAGRRGVAPGLAGAACPPRPGRATPCGAP